MSDSGHKTGFFGWHQLLTQEPDKAVAFYTALLGWRAEGGEVEGMSHHMLFNGEQAVASVLGVPADTGDALPHWHPHLNVDDVDAALARVEELGGRVVVEPGDIAGLGRLAVIQDPSGAVLTLVSPLDEDEIVPDAADVDGD